jgi:multicomponent Na+:H+ antiporter subunit G
MTVMLINIIAAALMAAGMLFIAVAAIGFVRLPNIFCRLHVMGIIDTLGAPLLLLGAALTLGASLAAGKLLLGLAFLFITSPLVGHLLSRAALEAQRQSGHQPEDEHPESIPDPDLSEVAA